MKQPTKKGKTSIVKNKTKKRTASKVKKTRVVVRPHHQKYGTSKLEEDFARDFLDKLGIKYIYQFEAKDIGRFYDFAIILNNEMTTGNMILIEIDGSYFHSDPRVVEEGKLNPMQKHNKRVDEYKDKWALLHGIPLIRIWEKDIRENPKMVMEELKKRLYIQDKKITITEKKNKRHINKIK
jgi:very-short-patch-repair endonuclease